jgi:predicted transcriptional regulator
MNKTQTILELFKAGNKPSQIAKEVGLTPQRINQILKEEGLKQNNFNYSPKITGDVAETVMTLHEQGFTVPKISKTVNITPQAIRTYLKKTRNCTSR